MCTCLFLPYSLACPPTPIHHLPATALLQLPLFVRLQMTGPVEFYNVNNAGLLDCCPTPIPSSLAVMLWHRATLTLMMHSLVKCVYYTPLTTC